MSDTVCFDTGCLVILCNSSFFWAQAPNTPIWKIVTPITVRRLGANKYATNQYTITDIYIPAKNS